MSRGEEDRFTYVNDEDGFSRCFLLKKGEMTSYNDKYVAHQILLWLERWRRIVKRCKISPEINNRVDHAVVILAAQERDRKVGAKSIRGRP